MFKNLTNLGYVRDGKEAIGFYIAYVLLFALIGAIEGVVLTPIVGIENLSNYILPISIFLHLALCYLILSKKMLQSEFEYIMISLVTGLTGYFLGAIGGMIIVSYLTTVEPRNEVKTKTEIE
jgi:uncharacterized membrane protein YfcA